MSYSNIRFCTFDTRSGLLSSTAIIAGMMVVFGAALPTTSFAQALEWAAPSSGGDNDYWSNDGDPASGPENWQGTSTRYNDDGGLDGPEVTFGGSSTILDVDLRDNVNPDSITFATDGYTILDSNPGSDVDRITALNMDNLLIDVTTAGQTATINAGISNQGTVTINGTGAGTLVIGGTSNTEDGAGVAGTYDLQGGTLIISGSTSSEDTVANNGGALSITGSVDGNVNHNTGTSDNSGTIGGTLSVGGGDFNNLGTGIVVGATTVTNGTLNNAGNLQSTLGVSGGTAVNQTGGTVTGLATVSGTGQLNANGGTFTNGINMTGGDLNVTDDTGSVGVPVAIANGGGTITVNDGVTLNSTLNNVSGDIDNNGTIAGAVTITAGTLDNGSGGMMPTTGDVEATVNINGGTAIVTNFAGSSITGAITMDNTVDDVGGTLEGNGGSFGTVQLNDGTFDVNATTTATSVTFDGDTVNGDEINIAAGQTLTTDFSQSGGTTTIATGGGLTDTNGLSVTGGLLQSEGAISGNVAISGTGQVDNNANGTIADQVTIADNGVFNVNSSVTNTSTAMSDGEVNIAAGQTLTTDFSQTGGATTIAATGGLTDADGLSVTGGLLQSAGAISGAVEIGGTGQLDNNAGGTITDAVTVTDTGIFNVNSSVSNTTTAMSGGAVNIADGQTLTTQFSQSGGETTIGLGSTLDDADGITVSGGTVTSQGAITGGVAISNDASVDNNANGSIAGDITINNTGELIADGGTFGGSVTVSDMGTFEVNTTTSVATTTSSGGEVNINAGTLTTDLEMDGGVVNVGAAGTLDDTTDAISVSSGTLTNAGTIVDQVTVNGGTLDVLVGSTLSTGVTATNGFVNFADGDTGDADVTVVLGAFDLVNQGAAMNIDDGVTLNDNVTNESGTFTSAATIDGTLDITGGQFTQNASTAVPDLSGVTGQVTVSGADAMNEGSLVANAGTFGGIQALANGDVEINGPVEGDVDNDGGTVTITGSGDLDGDLTNNTGVSDIQTNGQLDGDLLVNGGSVTNDGTITGAGGMDTNAVVLADGMMTTDDNSDIQGTTTVSGGTLQADGGDFGGSGIVGTNGAIIINDAVTGNVDVSATAAFTVTTDGVLDGDVTIAANSTVEAVNNGTIEQTLTVNGGVFQNNDLINGDNDPNGVVVNGGEFYNNDGGVISDPALVQGGTFFANGGNVITGAVTVTGTGNFTVIDDSAASVVNGAVGSSVTIDAGQTLTGNLDNNLGTAQINGTLNGALDVTDGVVNFNAGSGGVTGPNSGSAATTVSGGTLNANDGVFDTGILATGGAVNVGGSIEIAGGAALTADGGAVTILGIGNVDGDVVVDEELAGQTDLINTGIIQGTVTVTGASDPAETTFDNQNTVQGLVTANGGTVTNSGTLAGGVLVDGGFVTSSGNVQSPVTVDDGQFVITDGTITGPSTVNGGTFTAAGGQFNGGVTNDGGTVDVTANAAGNITNMQGTATVNTGATLTGVVTNATNGTINLGTTAAGPAQITGTLTNNGMANIDGTITGGTTNSGNNAEMTIATGDVGNFGATVPTGLTNENNATLTIQGAASGTITNNANVALDGGTIAAASLLDNNAILNVAGASVANGTIANAGTMTIGVASGPTATLAGTGTLTNENGSTLDITDAGTVSMTSLTNSDGATIELRGAISSALTNSGDLLYYGTSVLDDPDTDMVDETFIDPADATRLTGLVTNNADGNISLESGQMTFAGGLVNNGTVSASGPDGTDETIGDIITINNGLSGSGTFALDIDLSQDTVANGGNVAADGTGASDYVLVNGDASGDFVLDFNVLGAGAEPIGGFLVFDVTGDHSGLTLTPSGLPSGGAAVIYGLSENNSGSWFVGSTLNPALGGLAGSVVLTQSLIGSVINRPSSPFVSGLAYEDPDPCGPGVWTRGIGGQADTNGELTTPNGSLDYNGDVSADYAGFQAGGDIACFNGYFDGWDISIGGIAGVNQGSIEQPIFEVVPVGGGTDPVVFVQTDRQASVTDTDFDQSYAGVYLTGAYERFSVDLQYRFEQTDFTATNVGLNGFAGVGLTDSDFSSNAETFSGSVSYAIPFADGSFTFVPTAGFAYSGIETDPLTLDVENPGDTPGVLEVQDFTTETVFVGGTLSRTSFGDDNVSALTQFGTVTYYRDFADAPESFFDDGTAIEDELRRITTDKIESYTEISAGLNYLRILPLDAPLGAKQMNASLRGDLRGGDQLESWGLTGQFRVQF